MTRSPLLRPTLLPGLPRLRRTPLTVQLGLDPARAVLVDLPDPRAAHLLDLLDGSRPERVVVELAAQHGVTPEHTRAVLDVLSGAGLVLPGPSLVPPGLPDEVRRRVSGEAAALALRRDPAPARALRRRQAARVVLSGGGRLAAGVAVALAEAGVGHLRPDLTGLVTPVELPGGPLGADDVGRSRRETAVAAVQRAAPGIRTGPVRRGAASLVLQLTHEQPVALLAAGHTRRRQAHLALAVREGTVVVGPLVPSAGGPCLNCVDLHRRDRDPGWHRLEPPAGPLEPCAVTTVLAGTAYAAAEVLTFLDGGRPETLGAAVEVVAPGRVRRRSWPPHPGCGCARRQKYSRP